MLFYAFVYGGGCGRRMRRRGKTGGHSFFFFSIHCFGSKAGKKMMFGKEVTVKAKPAKTVVKAFPVAALKASI